MECIYCKEYLEIIDSECEIDTGLSYFYKGKCPLCKREFRWEEYFRLDFEGIFGFEELSKKG